MPRSTEERTVTASAVHSVFEAMVGHTCWSLIAGRGTGSVVALDIGPKSRRARPLTNDSLSEEQRHFEGEFGAIVYCAWRLDHRDRVVCGCWESNEPEGSMIVGLRELVGRRLARYEVLAPALDCSLHFEGDLRLSVFCTHTSLEEDETNYSLWNGGELVSVGARGAVTMQGRRGSRRGREGAGGEE